MDKTLYKQETEYGKSNTPYFSENPVNLPYEKRIFVGQSLGQVHLISVDKSVFQNDGTDVVNQHGDYGKDLQGRPRKYGRQKLPAGRTKCFFLHVITPLFFFGSLPSYFEK